MTPSPRAPWEPAPARRAWVAARLLIALTGAAAIMATSLWIVAALNREAGAAEPEPPPLPAVAIPLVAPPPEAQPDPIATPEPTAPAPATEAPPPPVSPPPPVAAAAPPAVPGLSPTAGPGGIAVGPIAGLASVGELPVVAAALPDSEAEPEITTPARATHRPAPTYPALAQRRGIEGHVTLRLRVDARGRVSEAVVVESEPEGVFDDTAVETVKRYRFTPARAGDTPVTSTIQQTIRFEVPR